MSRKIIGYKENSTNKYSITPEEQKILTEHSKLNYNQSDEMFISDKRMNEIKDMIKQI